MLWWKVKKKKNNFKKMKKKNTNFVTLADACASIDRTDHRDKYSWPRDVSITDPSSFVMLSDVRLLSTYIYFF